MKIECDGKRDLLYIYFQSSDKKSAKTMIIVPGVNADFDKENKLVGLEILDASEMIEETIEFDLSQMKMTA